MCPDTTLAKARLAVRTQLLESASLKEMIAASLLDTIVFAAMTIAECLENKGKVVIFGNGGSAADAQHLACELVGRFLIDRSAYAVIALTTNTSIITAVANDFGYDAIFERQVEALVSESDIVIGISTSGNSKNVIAGLVMAKKIGASTIGFIGRDGGEIESLVDIALTVPSYSTPRIQEDHITIGHIICGIVEEYLVEKSVTT